MEGKKEGRKDRINFDFTKVVDERGKWGETEEEDKGDEG